MPVAANPTPTSRLRLEKQTVDSNENAWGTRLNQSLDLVDLAFSTEEVTVSSDVTLTSTNYADNQSRALCLILSGDGGYAVTTPAVDKPYLVINNCTSDVTMKPSGGTAATIRAGTIVWYYNNAAGDTGYVVDPTLDKIKAPVASVAMGSQKLTGMAEGTATTDGATLSNRLDQFATPTASVAMGSQKITGLADGTIGSQDAAPVAQVQSLIASATVNLPAQTGSSGLFLTTDGTTPSWAENLPDQAGNTGKYLTTNGTAASWGAIALTTASTTGTAQTVDFGTTDVHVSTVADGQTVTYTFSNPSAVDQVTLIIDSQLGGWDVSTAVYRQAFSVNSEETAPRGMFFKPDGLKMYIVGITGDDVNEYDLSTAWDVGTASFSRLFSVSSQDTSPMDVFFKPDGLKMYVLGATGVDVNEYNLGVAWNISTAVYSQAFSVNSQETTPYGMFFKPDGSKMYIIGLAGDDVNEYDLSTAWDVSTAVYSQAFSVAAKEINPTDVFFKPDGTKMYVIGFSGDKVFEYDLSTAWDVSTSVFNQEFSTVAQDTDASGIFFSPDGTNMYVLGVAGVDVNHYTIPISGSFVFPASLEAPDIPLVGKTAIQIVTTDTGTSYQAISVQGGIE